MKSNLAQEMEHKLPKVVAFRFAAGAPYTLHINFNDGVDSKVDFQDVLEGELYGPLKDPNLFRQVKLEEGNLVWPNGADFDPEILHDWPQRKEAMVAAASRWRRQSPGYRGAIFYLAWYLLIGFVAGFVARSVLHTQKELVETTVLGIVGSILGGLIAHRVSAFSERAARHERVTIAYGSLAGAFLIPFVVVSLWRQFSMGLEKQDKGAGTSAGMNRQVILDSVSRLDSLGDDLRDDTTGKIDAKKVGELFGIKIPANADAARISRQSLNDNPASEKAQPLLKQFERVARLRSMQQFREPPNFPDNSLMILSTLNLSLEDCQYIHGWLRLHCADDAQAMLEAALNALVRKSAGVIQAATGDMKV